MGDLLDEDSQLVLEMRSRFKDEIPEMIQRLEEDLLDYERYRKPTKVDNILRVLHSIKGSAGSLELPSLVEFLNSFEFLSETLKSSTHNLETVFFYKDSLEALIQEIDTEEVRDIELQVVLQG